MRQSFKWFVSFTQSENLFLNLRRPSGVIKDLSHPRSIDGCDMIKLRQSWPYLKLQRHIKPYIHKLDRLSQTIRDPFILHPIPSHHPSHSLSLQRWSCASLFYFGGTEATRRDQSAAVAEALTHLDKLLEVVRRLLPSITSAAFGGRGGCNTRGLLVFKADVAFLSRTVTVTSFTWIFVTPSMILAPTSLFPSLLFHILIILQLQLLLWMLIVRWSGHDGLTFSCRVAITIALWAGSLRLAFTIDHTHSRSNIGIVLRLLRFQLVHPQRYLIFQKIIAAKTCLIS